MSIIIAYKFKDIYYSPVLHNKEYYLLEYLTKNDTIRKEDMIWVGNTLPLIQGFSLEDTNKIEPISYVTKH